MWNSKKEIAGEREKSVVVGSTEHSLPKRSGHLVIEDNARHSLREHAWRRNISDAALHQAEGEEQEEGLIIIYVRQRNVNRGTKKLAEHQKSCTDE